MSIPGQDTEVENKRMPLLQHLIELRQRLIYSLFAFFIAFGIAFIYADVIFDFLVRPLVRVWADAGLTDKRFIFTAMQEKFFTNVKVAMFAAAFVSFPFVAAQIWMFVAPGLYRNERRAFLPFLLATPIMFLVGAGFVYYVIMPMAWKFFAAFEQAAMPGEVAIVLEPKVNEYLSLVMGLIFAFGLCFEMPVALSLMARAGLVSADGLAEKRRYAIVAIAVVAAVLTPPDPISMTSLAVPLVILYEISIICARLIERSLESAVAGEGA
ncbi:MAG: twin-arginine translocase subunit TatC [Alphaproteobacteria bacterium]|nr:twin-arginine translocase subunit TatC [Alphaproteobacteria bacterium]